MSGKTVQKPLSDFSTRNRYSKPRKREFPGFFPGLLQFCPDYGKRHRYGTDFVNVLLENLVSQLSRLLSLFPASSHLGTIKDITAPGARLRRGQANLRRSDKLERNCQNCDHVGNHRALLLDGSINEHEGMLVCRRYPPTFAVVNRFDRTESEAMWPRVAATDRCGEFTPKEPTE